MRFSFHPSDEDLSLGAPVERKPRRLLSPHSTATVKRLYRKFTGSGCSGHYFVIFRMLQERLEVAC
jgi:hypothetical protein